MGRIKAELNYILVPDLGKVDIGQCIQLCRLSDLTQVHFWSAADARSSLWTSGAGNVAMYSNCPVILSSHYVAREG